MGPTHYISPAGMWLMNTGDRDKISLEFASWRSQCLP